MSTVISLEITLLVLGIVIFLGIVSSLIMFTIFSIPINPFIWNLVYLDIVLFICSIVLKLILRTRV